MTKEITLEELLSARGNDFTEISFEKGLKLLEELVARVEQGSLPLDQAMCAYERGVDLAGHLQKQLAGAEEKLKLLKTRGTGDVCGPQDVDVREAEEQ